MKGLARALPLLAGIAGAVVGEAAWQGALEERSSRAPPDWTLEASRVPTRLGSLVGRVPPDPTAWSLDYWGTLWPEDPHLHSGPAPISTRVRLPPDGQLELWTSLPRGPSEDGGVGLVLERLGEPGSRLVRRDRGQLESVACEPPLAPPTLEAVSVRIEPLRGGVVVEIDGQRSDCPVPLGESGPALRSGLRRVQLRDLEVGQVKILPPGPALRPLWWATGALIAAGLVGLELWLGATAALVALTTLPLCLSLLALRVDLRSFAETARILWLPVPLAGGAGAPFAGWPA